MIMFIKEFNLVRISLSVFHEEKNSVLTRMMALKFFKSLYALDDKDLLLEMCEAKPITFCLPVAQNCRTKLNSLNMFQSSVLDLFNQHGLAVYKHLGLQCHQQMVAPYLDSLAWSPTLLDKFFYPYGKKPKSKPV